MKVLLIDNYDSFTYNLVHMIDDLGFPCEVFRNDKIALEQVSAYDKIMLSPGPGIPDEAGIMKELIAHYGSSKQIMGVCLGHQAIAEVYGAQLFNMTDVLHGVTSKVHLVGDSPLFNDVPDEFVATHYHSWAVKPESLGVHLRMTASNEQGMVMAIEHNEYKVTGLQFHPESILTTHGRQIIANWLNH